MSNRDCTATAFAIADAATDAPVSLLWRRSLSPLLIHECEDIDDGGIGVLWGTENCR